MNGYTSGLYRFLRYSGERLLTMRLGQMGKYLVFPLTLQMKPRLGVKPSELRPIEKIASVRGAVFIITGALDKHTTLSESKRFFEAAHEPKLFWEIEGAGHVDFSRYTTDKYQEKILWYFSKYMK